MASTSLSKAEKSYIQTSLLSDPPLRADGRALHAFRTIALETGVAPLANGSARLSIGGTEILAAVKLEVEDIVDGEGVEGGRVVCSVSCSPAAYPHLSSPALDDLQHDLTTVLHQTLAHPSLHPGNLSILQGKKSWLLSLDALVLCDAGNVWDALFMAARAALWDTRVPRTRSVEYKAPKASAAGGSKEGGAGDMEVDLEAASGFDTRQVHRATDFELPDYWDEGDVLSGRDRWPVSVTLNVLAASESVSYVDATAQEEVATPLKLVLAFSFSSDGKSKVQAMRLLGPGELKLARIKVLAGEGEKYAREVFSALNAKLKEEDLRRNQKARDRFASMQHR
ncbi:hypothetical protein PLICRDRAFT_38740 [Plicaturopsis crispa FD-325 SS-3]|nr:hypothetical protein PLICRDRAFT_38740 [Plicaturopsis crispa FD-325 SS-3]